jgi:hypothetical protein
VRPNASFSDPADDCPAAKRARIPVDPFTPTDVVRLKAPPELSNSKYFARRSLSKSSQKIHSDFAEEHSATTGDPVPPVLPVLPVPPVLPVLSVAPVPLVLPPLVVAAATVTETVVRVPPTLALIVVDPTATPVTRPVAPTVATEVLALAHVTVIESICPL